MRALFVRAAVEGPVVVLSVVNDDEKTVARLSVDGPLMVDGGERLPPRIRVEALRGYGKNARRAARRLAVWPGLRPAEEPLFLAVCASNGMRPGVYRAKPETGLDPTMPARLAFAAVLDELLDIARIHVEGTLRQLDTEFLHDLRVAVRRSRSVLKAARCVFDERQRASYAAELKWIGDITTPSRDLDVYLLGFDDLVAHAGDPDAMRPFRTLLAQNCRKSHTALNRALRSKRFARLVDGWPTDLAASDEHGPEADTAILEIAGDRLRRSWRRVRKRGNAITTGSPPGALLDLRKRCKELRYLLEVFASLYQTSEHKQIIGELKRLQDNLGEFQDAENQRLLILQYPRSWPRRARLPPHSSAWAGSTSSSNAAKRRRGRSSRLAGHGSTANPTGARSPRRWQPPEDPGVVQHQGRSREDDRGGQPRSAGRPGGPPGSAVGPRPARRRDLPVPGPT